MSELFFAFSKWHGNLHVDDHSPLLLSKLQVSSPP